MSKFDELYPYHPTHITQEAIPFGGTELIKYGEPGICWHCGDETEWIDTIFGSHLCSEECECAKWKEYAEISLQRRFAYNDVLNITTTFCDKCV